MDGKLLINLEIEMAVAYCCSFRFFKEISGPINVK